MENGFICKEAPFCIHYAGETVKKCKHVIAEAREKGIPVFFIKRAYRGDGSDVEITRYEKWNKEGRGMQPGSTGIDSAQAPEGLQPEEGDYTIIKPRWSAFFATELDLLLRRLGIRTIILIGTTTPNCVRSTAYDGNSLDYEVVVVEDCCSSQTEEIQRINISDMERMGAHIISSEKFCKEYNGVPDSVERIRKERYEGDGIPEQYDRNSAYVMKQDIW